MPKTDFIYADPTANASGSTPYGIYDDDSTFQEESKNLCKWVARRLGHPVMQLEFDSGSIYAMFEESVSEYSLHINNYNIKNWLWDHLPSTELLKGLGLIGASFWLWFTGSLECTAWFLLLGWGLLELRDYWEWK